MPEICPFCGSTATVKDSKLIYGKSYGMALICDRFPSCDAYATVYHEGRYMADKELRALRKNCHDNYFDPLWKNGSIGRSDLYDKLRKFLNVSSNEAHFGKLSKEQCKSVIIAIQQNIFLNGKKLVPKNNA